MNNDRSKNALVKRDELYQQIVTRYEQDKKTLLDIQEQSIQRVENSKRIIKQIIEAGGNIEDIRNLDFSNNGQVNQITMNKSRDNWLKKICKKIRNFFKKKRKQ